MNKLKLTFLMLLFFTIGATAQQAKSKSKPVRQVTQNTLPAPKNTTPPVKGVGVVIKRNPGSGASKISGTTNAQGETIVTITEKGNYVITMLQPTPTGTAMTETNGGPVQGVKVGLGKNPSGLLVSSQPVNNKGEVEFKDLEPGSYTIKIISNEVNCPPGFIMNNGVCEPLPKVATSQPVKAATNIRPVLVNPEATPVPAAITAQVGGRNTCQSNIRPLIVNSNQDQTPVESENINPINLDSEVIFRWVPIGDYPKGKTSAVLEIWIVQNGVEINKLINEKPNITQNIATGNEAKVRATMLCNPLPCPNQIVWSVTIKDEKGNVIGKNQPTIEYCTSK